MRLKQSRLGNIRDIPYHRGMRTLHSRKRDDEPIPLTEEGFVKLKDKLSRLKASLPDLIAETARTAAYGDRSENAEYQMAKSTLRRTHRQIWTIEAQLKRIVIIRPRGPSGIVELGSTVVLECEGKERIYQIVGPQETNPEKNRISHKSPLGAALLRHPKGATILLRTEMGIRKYKILDIR
ncbi:MAG: transcription elongation factor GreA [Candidatus Liptonbacteria bacterium]|nr:transcription elongation factor GreA [Candidatus Liptonbacteria bacterium]